MIISVDNKESIWQNTTSFMIKALNKLRIEGMYLNKGHVWQPHS